MSQNIQFYTITIFSETFVSEFNEETSPFSLDSIYKCLKELFKGTENFGTVDYKTEKFDSQFVIINPNAKSTCGCGSSFNA
jgi:hypothetical protein